MNDVSSGSFNWSKRESVPLVYLMASSVFLDASRSISFRFSASLFGGLRKQKLGEINGIKLRGIGKVSETTFEKSSLHALMR